MELQWMVHITLSQSFPNPLELVLTILILQIRKAEIQKSYVLQAVNNRVEIQIQTFWRPISTLSSTLPHGNGRHIPFHPQEAFLFELWHKTKLAA